MKFKNKIIDLFNKLPPFDYINFKKNTCFPAGHYYSPIVSVKDIKNRQIEIWDKANADNITGIDLRTVAQLQLMENLTKYYDDLPFKPERQPNIRYNFENGFYSYTDGIVLYSIIRHFKPRRIIEIGSGFSSAVMLDTSEFFLDSQIAMTFIEPYPERLLSIMKDVDKGSTTIIPTNVQKVDLNKFEKLQAGDILFIDSTHVVKTGSDVNYILFEILPVLQTGVLIHFHDIFYPFEYPKEWVFLGHNWNESYFLRAFLMNNNLFEIQLFSDYIHKHHKEAFTKMPLSYKNTGGNLWLMKK